MTRGRLGAVAATVLTVLTVLGVGLAVAPAASADTIDDAVNTLKSSPLYVASGAQGKVNDRSAVDRAFGSSVKAAVFPSGVNGDDAVSRLTSALSSRTTLAVVVGTKRRAVSGIYCSGFANTQLDKAFSDTSSQLNSNGGDLTQTFTEFASNLQGGPTCSGGSGGKSDTNSSGSSSDSGTNVWPWLAGLGVLGAGGIGGLVFFRKRKKKRELDDARAAVMPYYDRLANEVNTVDTKGNATARQAMADASERFTSAGSQLAAADSIEKFAQARRTVLEGLYATQTARKATGVDPGPELPPIDDRRSGDQLTEARQVEVQGQTFQGYPNYTPGAPYYYGGGYGVPGGWYGVPFWETMLLGSVLAGGFGGWGYGGGGYGAGYDSGFESGYEQGRDSSDSSGTDWGGGGTDWGSGGGDWGGGGGDWGGGGGDWGGGGGDGGGGW